MKQPDLGNKIIELRKKKGITQKELADSCNIDIRTIQRIEAGDVIPRMSTLKLIAKVLESDLSDFNIEKQTKNSTYIKNVLLISFVIGIIYFVDWFFFTPILPKNEILLSLDLAFWIISTFTTVLFYYGFYELGKIQGNQLIKITSIIIMICAPIYLITLLIADIIPLNKLILSILGFNSIIFGVGLLKSQSRFIILYRSAGIIQILSAPFFIIPIDVLNLVGCWIDVPFLILLLIILYMEYKDIIVTNLTLK